MNDNYSQYHLGNYVNGVVQEWEQLRAALTMMDINEMNRVEKSLKRRDMMMNIGTRAAEILLSTEDEENIESALTDSLELVGVSADIDWVCIWRNETILGELHFVLDYEWTSRPGMDNTSQLPIGFKFPYRARPEWKKMFLRGECINGPLSEMSLEDQKFFKSFDLKSIVIIPLLLQDQFWGFVSLADLRNERVFPEDEINILRLISLMIASAVNSGAQAAKLREAHERTRLLLDAMPLACHLWNRDLTIFDCNEENTRLFNLKDKTEIKDFFYMFSPEYQPDGQLSSEKAAKCIQKVFDDGISDTVEWAHQTSDGIPIPAEITLVRLPYEDDYVVAGYIRDMREHNKMMEEIEQNKTKLEAANDAKSAFLASMSHEMRTPLNAVIGLSGLTLEMEGLDEDVKKNLEKIHNAGSTLLSIVNDILDISKIEAGKFELMQSEYDTPSLINDTIIQNILRIGDKPIEFHLDICPQMPTRLYGDELRVKQILSNLLSNAFKYTKQGLVELGICGERETGSDTIWITAWVRDTGMGIRPEDLDKLFSAYSQLDLKTNHHIEGTGLGLAITKKILDAMDGTITVESEYGKGSIFTIRFKQKFVTDVPIGDAVVKNLKSFQYSDDMRNKDAQIAYIKIPQARVLVVDDNTTNLDVAKGLMKPYAMRIDCVTSGQDAIDAIRAGKVKYDAIFMDHMMPGMDGIEATGHIRDIGTDYAKKIPIIALTANAVNGSKEMFLSKGFQAFLSKPINLKQLDSTIKRWIRKKVREVPEPETKTVEVPGTCKMAEMRELPTIEGIYVQKVFDLYSGRMEIYLPVLRSFADNTPGIVKKLRSVTAKSLPIYTITVHGLKGASASIGAEEVREKCFNLEKMAKAGDLQGVLLVNEAFLRDVDILVDKINVWLMKYDAIEKPSHLHAPAPAILARLRQYLIDYDIKGIDDTMEVLRRADYESDADLIPWLEDKIIESDFEDAAERIAEILNVERR